MKRDQPLADAPRRTLGGLELRFPPLPQTLVEAIELIEQPDQLDVARVTEMVQRDPIVIARLLQIVNSAYYGLRHSISSAERAVVMLGPVAVAGVVVGMNMMKLRSIMEGTAATCFHHLIRHSIATAFLSRHLLEGSPREQAARAGKNVSRIGVSFTAGMLHDFGKIILVYNFPEEAADFYLNGRLNAQIQPSDTRELEQLLFGCDHTEAGEFVARKLSFPDLLTDVIRLHHDPAGSSGLPDTDRVVRATHAANLASKAMGFAFTEPLTWEQVAEDPVWEMLLQKDFPRFESPASLMAELREQEEHLQQYVANMMTSSSASKPKRGSMRRLNMTL